MSRWIVVVVVADASTTNKGRVEHEVERADQLAAIEAVLGRQLPCKLEREDQVLIYAEPLEGPEAPEVILDLPRPPRDPADPYGKKRKPPAEPPPSPNQPERPRQRKPRIEAAA